MSMDLMVRVMKVRVGDPLSKLALLKLAETHCADAASGRQQRTHCYH